MPRSNYQPDPRLDLVLERIVDVPPDLVWAAWTTPEHLKPWFTPAPWKTVECEIDLRPGGMFRTVMRSPDGQDTPHVGCYLEVSKNERLVWTNALAPGYRPIKPSATEANDCSALLFTAVISIEPHKNGTKYTAFAMHGDESSRIKHADMGFHEGWGTALDQLVTYVKQL